MPSIADSVVEMVQWVFPEHAGAPGQIHGGRMMQWITEAGTLAAARVARGHVVLGATDDIDFLHPVRVGQIAILRAQVEYVGTSSLEVGVRVWAEDVATGARAVTLNSHLVFVKMGDEVRPRRVPVKIWPTLTGWRKSISSIAPRTTWPRATRTAASVPAWVIHSIMRPPWIWPGAPACSGNTHWTISTTVSAIDGIRALYHLGRLSRVGRGDVEIGRAHV